uniref:Putative Bcl-2-like protein antagonist/killer 2 n=1 Tax=Magallana gigas TaxID=29159 RepID=K1P6Q7_MAGGI
MAESKKTELEIHREMMTLLSHLRENKTRVRKKVPMAQTSKQEIKADVRKILEQFLKKQQLNDDEEEGAIPTGFQREDVENVTETYRSGSTNTSWEEYECLRCEAGCRSKVIKSIPTCSNRSPTDDTTNFTFIDEYEHDVERSHKDHSESVNKRGDVVQNVHTHKISHVEQHNYTNGNKSGMLMESEVWECKDLAGKSEHKHGERHSNIRETMRPRHATSGRTSSEKDRLYTAVAEKLAHIGDHYKATSPLSDSTRSSVDNTATRRASARTPNLPGVDERGSDGLTALERQLIDSLREVGDSFQLKLSPNAVKEIVKQAMYQRFQEVVDKKTGPGNSWDHIAAVFYLTKKVVTMAGVGRAVALQVKDLAAEYVADKFATWIVDQGGWGDLGQMAYWDGGSGTRGGGRVPPSSDVRQIPSPSEQMTPDTEENVIDEAEDVIRNFIFESYQHQLVEEVDTLDSTTPQVPELCAFTSDPMSRASQVGRQLARIGDDINRRYADEFKDMINQLNVNEDTAYEVFAGVAKKLFADEINWGRVAALMCLAYRITMTVVKEKAKKFAQFMKVIVSHVVRFIKEKIAGWIASQGGWSAALQYSPSMSFTSLSIVVGSCVAAIAAVFYFSKKS